MVKTVIGGGIRVPYATAFGTRVKTSITRVSAPQDKSVQPSRNGGANKPSTGAARSTTTVSAANVEPAVPSDSVQAYPKGFDVSMAASLAGCAFHAYLDPKQTNLPKLKYDDGTTVTFISREFLMTTDFHGVLQVELKSATGLRDQDWIGKSDPYAILSIGKSAAQSKMVEDSTNPQWNESFQLLVKNLDEDVLRVQVWDDDAYTADDTLGQAEMPVKGLKPGSSQDIDLELEGGKGKVKMTLKYVPLEDAAAASNAKQLSDTSNASDKTGKPVTAYADIPPQWQALASAAGRAAQSMFTPICFIENAGSETQAWVHWGNQDSDASKELVLSFRGTEQVEWKDLVTDAAFFLSKLDKDIANAIEDTAPIELDDDIKVHSGFNKAYDTVKQTVEDVVDMIIDDSSDWQLHITGHSLGGALATLCSIHMASREKLLGKVEMYNFGSPRVGNQSFSTAFNALVPSSWRLRNTKDAVAAVPFLLGYAHVGTRVALQKDGSLKFTLPEEDKLEGASMDDILGEVMEGAMDEVFDDLGDGKLTILQDAREISERTGEVVNPLIERQKKLLCDIMDGSGLEDHMEDVYLLTMSGCVDREFKK